MFNRKNNTIAFQVPIIAEKTIRDFYYGNGYDDTETFDSFTEYLNACNCIIDKLTVVPYGYKDRNGDPTSFIRLSSTYLRETHLKQYATILQDLVKMGFIKIDDYYSEMKGICKGYKMVGNYQYHEVPCTDTLLFRRLKRRATKINTKLMKDKPEVSAFIEDLNKNYSEIKFNIDEAEAIENRYTETDEDKDGLKVKQCMQYSIEKLKNDDFDTKISETNGRLTSVHTSTKRVMRTCFSDKNDEPFMNIDIKQCQPTLLLSYFNLVEKVSSIDSEYERLVLNDDLYNWLVEQMYKFQTPPEDARDKIKKAVLTYFFSDNWKVQNIKNNKYISVAFLFEKQFPTLDAFLYKVKDCPNGGSALAIKLQIMESDLMIRTVCPILLQIDGMNFIPVHDSIMVTCNYSEFVKEVITEKFQELYGIVPQVKIKRADD